MELTKSTVDEVKARHYDFYDGVVCSIRLQMKGKPWRCEILVEAMDKEAESGWSHVLFVVQGVSEFRFEEVRSTFVVLSFGIQFGWIGRSVYIVLAASPDGGAELPDLKTNTAYVAGATCELEVTPIPKSAIGRLAAQEK